MASQLSFLLTQKVKFARRTSEVSGAAASEVEHKGAQKRYLALRARLFKIINQKFSLYINLSVHRNFCFTERMALNFTLLSTKLHLR